MKKEKSIYQRIRKPLPLKKGGAHSTKKGERGYDRARDKKQPAKNWSNEIKGLRQNCSWP